MSKTIFLDFDGVVRFWSNAEIGNTENKLGLDEGTLFDVAFSEELLMPAITGIVSDELWRKNVESEIGNVYGNKSANRLMLAWENSTYQIDYKFLEAIKSANDDSKLVLITNATSRLKRDLDKSKLNRYFDFIVNSSEMGFAKPSAELFRIALAVAECSAADCLFIDDSAQNVLVAENMGIASLLFTDSNRALQFISKVCV